MFSEPLSQINKSIEESYFFFQVEVGIEPQLLTFCSSLAMFVKSLLVTFVTCFLFSFIVKLLKLGGKVEGYRRTSKKEHVVEATMMVRKEQMTKICQASYQEADGADAVSTGRVSSSSGKPKFCS